MITQYSQVQLTLSEREKEYAWFHYAAGIVQSGCMDQQMSGYKVTGKGIDGRQIEAELTNEELFQIFSEITMKYGKQLVNREYEQELEKIEQMNEKLESDGKDRPLARRDFQILITRNEQKTRKADVAIIWGNNLRTEGMYIAGRSYGGVRLNMPIYFMPNGERVNLITVGSQLQQAILNVYQQMQLENKDQSKSSYIADNSTELKVQTRPADEGAVIGYADMQIGQELRVQQIRIRYSNGKLSCMYPAQAIRNDEKKQWHNLAKELAGCQIHEIILDTFRREHSRKIEVRAPCIMQADREQFGLGGLEERKEEPKLEIEYLYE